MWRIILRWRPKFAGRAAAVGGGCGLWPNPPGPVRAGRRSVVVAECESCEDRFRLFFRLTQIVH